MHDYAGGLTRTKLVSARDVARALAGAVDLTSGLLPPEALWWSHTATGTRIAVWREPRVWTVRLRERYDAPPRRLRLPMPGLVFVCLPGRQAPYVFAATARPRSVDAPLYHCPTYNVFASGRVCTGSHAFPADPGRVPEEFFRSYFSATGDTGGGRSRRYPDDIGRLWAELRGKATYPLTTSSRSCGSPTRCIWETDRSVSMALVEYLIARDGMPPRRGLAYDYVLAGNGLYLAAANRYLEVRVPVAAVPVRGLPPIYPSITLRTGRLPLSVWDQILVMARTLSRGGLEVMLAVTHDEAAGYRLILPQQAVGPVHVRYRPLDHVVLEIHSHRRYPARFSATDDADEQGLRLYGVLGRLDRMRPEVALRVGAYGHFLPVPWETVFAGDRGAFRDANFEPDTEGATDDDVPG